MAESAEPAARLRALRRTGRIAARALTPLAILVVWTAMLAPNRFDKLGVTAFLRIPIEAVVLVGVSLLLPPVARRVFAGLVGALLGLLMVLKILDMGFYSQLDRPFNPVIDRSALHPAIGVLRNSVGHAWANALVSLVLVFTVLIVVVVALATMRVAASASRHRQVAVRSAGALGTAWVVSALLSVHLVPGTGLASASAADLAAGEVHTIQSTIEDERVFAATLAGHDPQEGIPTSHLLSGLKGKDVILAFVESYGQVAVHGTDFSQGVDQTLLRGTADLRAAGFDSRSAFLTSPTFGGISWLAHSTLQSGLWIDSQQRYDQLLQSDRATLSSTFQRAGWQTVSDIPSDAGPWPEGQSFYRFDRTYDASNVGYRGPRFSYARIPDQYSLAALQRLELTPGHAPVMAEIDLDSSHTPWTPLPPYVPWSRLGDGSVYDDLPPIGGSPSDVWRSSTKVQQMYGLSIQYSLRSLVSFVTRSHDKNLVLILLGDHQPSPTVSGYDATHDVPISIVARDPSVFRQISSWTWQPGLLPGPDAPTWPMDAFRDRFLDAFSAAPDSTHAQTTASRELR